MNFFQAILLGIVQGITEFLPISSSAHLVILPYLLGWNIPNEQAFPFDVLVQLGTLLALIIYFRQDLLDLVQSFFSGIKSRQPFKESGSRLVWLIILATIPAGLAGLFLKDLVEQAFGSPAMTAFFLFGTAFLLIIAEVLDKRTKELSKLKWHNALIIGAFQALSIFPGISRSGACISAGMIQNLHRKDASRFAFLMAIPVMLAAGLLGMIDLLKLQNLGQFLPILAVGFLISAIVGYFVIHWLLRFVSQHSLLPFAIYCIIVGIIVLTFNLLLPGSTPSATSSNTAESIYVDSNLDWLIPFATTCNKTVANSSFGIRRIVNIQQDFSSIHYLGYSLPSTENATTFLLGYEKLLVVVSPQNPLEQLTRQQVQQIFSGQTTTWADFAASCPECSANMESSTVAQQAIQNWVYPSNSQLQIVIDSYLQGKPTSDAFLAPTPKILREAIQINPSAIGFLPSRWLDLSVKTVNLLASDSQQLQLPVLASLAHQPDQILTSFLLCLQSSLSK